MIREAVILCGGQSLRMRPLTETMPKAMIPIRNKSLIDYHIEWLKKHGVTKIILACGYQYEKIQQHLGNKVVYSVEKEPLGTAGALRLAMKHIEGKEFFVINGDDLTDVDLTKLAKTGSNALCLGQFRSPYGLVHTHGNDVVGFEEKPLLKDLWASIGIYLLNKDIQLPEKGSLEQDVFPKIRLKAYKHGGFWFAVNTIKDVQEVEKILK